MQILDREQNKQFDFEVTDSVIIACNTPQIQEIGKKNYDNKYILCYCLICKAFGVKCSHVIEHVNNWIYILSPEYIKKEINDTVRHIKSLEGEKEKRERGTADEVIEHLNNVKQFYECLLNKYKGG